MIIFAHRGASAYAPENTLEAFEKALSMGAFFYETDVQLTKDGVLVLCHDTSTSQGKVIKKETFKALTLPSLKELLDFLPPTARLNIEIKNDEADYPGIEEKIIALLNDYGADLKDRILISSFNYSSLKKIRALDKEIKIGVLTKSFDIKQALDIKAYSLNIGRQRVTAEIVETCHKNNIKVFVYTVNESSVKRALQNIGVDGIFSDYPDIA